MHGHTNIKQKFYIRRTEGMSVIFLLPHNNHQLFPYPTRIDQFIKPTECVYFAARTKSLNISG